MSALDLKLCPKCGTHKHMRLFSMCKRSRDGHQAHCKACDKVYATAWRAARGIKPRVLARKRGAA